MQTGNIPIALEFFELDTYPVIFPLQPNPPPTISHLHTLPSDTSPLQLEYPHWTTASRFSDHIPKLVLLKREHS